MVLVLVSFFTSVTKRPDQNNVDEEKLGIMMSEVQSIWLADSIAPGPR